MNKGDIVFVKIPGDTRIRPRATVVAKSARTGGLTVELLEGSGAYKVGDRVHVAQYECELYKFQKRKS